MDKCSRGKTVKGRFRICFRVESTGFTKAAEWEGKAVRKGEYETKLTRDM